MEPIKAYIIWDNDNNRPLSEHKSGIPQVYSTAGHAKIRRTQKINMSAFYHKRWPERYPSVPDLEIKEVLITISETP